MTRGRSLLNGSLALLTVCAVVLSPFGSPGSPASILLTGVALPSGAGSNFVSLAAKMGTPVEPATAGWVARHNLDMLGISEFVKATQVTGAGQTIAFVDTGIDPVTFATRTGGGQIRMKDWVDLTGEGTVTSFTACRAENGYLSVGQAQLKLGAARSRSDRYLVGTLPRAIVSQMGPLREVYFVLVDTDAAGIYNSVIIDTDSDLTLEDEFLLRKFGSDQSSATVQIDEQTRVSVLVSDVALDGQKVTFGFDLSGHGTSLAVIACGSGSYPGVAPGANVISIKAIGSQRTGNWADVRRGIEYALSARAGVILVGSVPQQSQPDPEWTDLQQRVLKAGAQLVMPAGNNGPGAGTITTTALRDATVMVSGYMPAGSANALFKTSYSADVWYPISSCGPDRNGDAGPLAMAPAITAVPLAGHLPDSTFMLMEGTSVSAAYAAGSLVLLRQAAVTALGQPSPSASQVYRSLSEGSRPLPDLASVEQGSGRMDIARAWDFLKRGSGDSNIRLVRKWDGLVESAGTWLKGTTLGAMPLWVDSFAPRSRIVGLSSTAPWLSFQSNHLSLRPVSQRGTLALGQGSLTPGFYSADIVANDLETPGVDGRLTVSVSVPHRFNLSGMASFNMGIDSSRPVDRQFIRMPETAESVRINISATGSGTHYALYNPEGLLVSQGAAGASTTLRIGIPEPGLWQICLFAANLGAPASARVEASLDGFAAEDLGVSGQSQYFLAHLGAGKYEFKYLGPDSASEWRQRQSISLPANTSTQIAFAVTDSSAKMFSFSFGTATGSYLMAYLIRFDATLGKWVDVAKGITRASGFGEITVDSPPPGNYMAYVEAYGTGHRVYVEMDALILRAETDGPAPVVSMNASAGTTGTLTVTPRQSEGEARTIVVTRASDGKVAGVFSRALVAPSESPVVQLTGGQGVKTIRAWSRSDMKPLDILVTVGSASYQLTEGRVTTGVTEGQIVSIPTKDGSRMLLLPSSPTR
ncbi:MAG: S8 family serine peptidase [Bacillota bacterium]